MIPNPLSPWIPSADDPWDRSKAAHLLRRAGFEPSLAERELAFHAGLDPTVERLISTAADDPRHDELDALGPTIARRDTLGVAHLRHWWLARAVKTNRPFHARLTHFWHNHFATSNTKIRNAAAMLQQIRTIEANAAGPFGQLMLAMARDPAMIVWLDGDRNERGRPNENFARELFELFTLGVGHYTEQDIREAARAFTGWGQRHGKFRFSPSAHDENSKTVLGVTGDLDGTDIVHVAVKHPSCAEFLSRKLLREFLTPNPSPELVSGFATALRNVDMQVGSAMALLFRSRVMFDPAVRRARIKSPVEFVIGLSRSWDLSVREGSITADVAAMGQPLLEPPSVKGWDGHRDWINAGSMLMRISAAQRSAKDHLDADRWCEEHAFRSPAESAAFAAEVMLDAKPPSGVIERAAASSASPQDALRSAVAILASTPEYQMC